MTKSKWWVALITLIALFGAACGGDDDDTSAGQSSSATEDGGSEPQTVTVRISSPLSGNQAASGVWAHGIKAFLDGVNADGGVNGAIFDVEVVDDGFEAARTTANIRKFIDQDGADVIFTYGGGAARANEDYIERSKVMTVPYAGGQYAPDGVEELPYFRSWAPSIIHEGFLITQQIFDDDPNAKVGVLSYDNVSGEKYAEGVQSAAEEAGKEDQIVAVDLFDPLTTDLTSNITRLRDAGATSLVLLVAGGAGTQAIKYVRQIGWEVPVYNQSGNTSRTGMLEPMGADAVGLRTPRYLVDAGDLPDEDWVDRFIADVEREGNGDPTDLNVLNGYTTGATLVEAVKAAGDDLSVEGILAGWDSLEGVTVPGLLPGVTLSPGDDINIIRNMQLAEWNGTGFDDVGDVVAVD